MQRSLNEVQLDFLNPTVSPATLPAYGGPAREHDAPTARDATARLADTGFCQVTREPESATLWVRLKADAPVKFTPALLADLRALQNRIAARIAAPGAGAPIRYQIFASAVPGVFSLGGDLALFLECIRQRDTRALRIYARDAVDLVHANATGYGAPVTAISLVQGQALGGGFEAALASHVLVAERGSRMGLPEVMFNMFPGMGAWQLLCRRLPPAEAERLILSGRTYTAEELHALGVVDVLADDGDGENAVRRYIRAHDRQHHGHSGFRRALQAASPLERHELYRMADIWVETAVGLGPRDLETIEYLLRAQERLLAKAMLARSDAGMLMGA